MLRDELIKALEAQPHDTDVQFDLGGFLLDVARVDYDEARVSIVLSTLAADIEEVVFHVAQRPWWRGTGTPSA
jgi:hypothetical protein